MSDVRPCSCFCDAGDETPLRVAALRGNVDVARLLLDKGAHVNLGRSCGDTPLHGAVRSGDMDVMNLLLNRGANVNIGNNSNVTPIHLAANDGDVDAVKLLIGSGANVNRRDVDDSTPLHWAATDHLDVVKLLMENGAVFSCGEESPLHVAARNARPDIVKFFVEHGVDVNVRSVDRLETPLHSTLNCRMRTNVGADVREVLKVLLCNGADDSLVDSSGRTPLESAWNKASLPDGVVEVLTAGPFLFRTANFTHVLMGAADSKDAKPKAEATEAGKAATKSSRNPPLARVAEWEDMLWLCAVWLQRVDGSASSQVSKVPSK